MELIEKLNFGDKINLCIKNEIVLFHVFKDEDRGNNLLFVTKQDKVYAIGNNKDGILGVGHSDKVDSPQEIVELEGMNIKEFFIGINFVIAQCGENKIFAWGNNNCLQLYNGLNFEENLSMKPKTLNFSNNEKKIRKVFYYQDWNKLIILLEENCVYLYFNNQDGVSLNQPIMLEIESGMKMKNFDFRKCSINSNNYIFCCFKNDLDQIEEIFEIFNEDIKFIIPFSNNIVDVKCNGTSIYFILNDQTLKIIDNKNRIGASKIKSIKLETKLVKLERIEDRIIALNDNNVVCELNGRDAITDYNTFDDYSMKNFDINYRTIKIEISDHKKFIASIVSVVKSMKRFTEFKNYVTPKFNIFENCKGKFFNMKKSWGIFESYFIDSEKEFKIIMGYSIEKLICEFVADKEVYTKNQVLLLDIFEFALFEHLANRINNNKIFLNEIEKFTKFYDDVLHACFFEVLEYHLNFPQNLGFEYTLTAIKHWRKHVIEEIFIKNIKKFNEYDTYEKYISDAISTMETLVRNSSVEYVLETSFGETVWDNPVEESCINFEEKIDGKKVYITYVDEDLSRKAHLKTAVLNTEYNFLISFYRDIEFYKEITDNRYVFF